MDFSLARQFMIDSQIRPSGATDPELVAAFANTPREAFVPTAMRPVAYSEISIETAEDRALWRPRDLALLIEAAEPAATDVALIVGAGAGYETALLSHLVETAIGLEEGEADSTATSERLAEHGFDSALCVPGKLEAGLADQAPFDLILIAGMVETLPSSWTDQLSEGGRLAVVVSDGSGYGHARIYTKAGGTVAFRNVFEVSVPKFPAFDKATNFAF